MLNKFHTRPLETECCHKICQSMKNLDSLAEISRKETVYRVVNYLLEDKVSLEKYLTGMAALFTKQREKITYQRFTESIFHSRQKPHLLNDDFLYLINSVIDREGMIQSRKFIAENHLQADIHSDLWKMYERHGDTLHLSRLDFSLIHCHSLRYELKYHLQHVLECMGKITAPSFNTSIAALNAIASVNPRIRCFADITEADAKAMLFFLENKKKRDGTPLSQSYIAKIMCEAKKIIEYLMSDICDSRVKTPKPYMNPFANFTFHNLHDYYKRTPVIPEEIIEQLNKHSDELSPLNKLLYDIFVSTGMRAKEVFLLKADCIEPSCYDGVCQLKFTPHKSIAARRRRGVGDYHRIMITKSLANRLSCYIRDMLHLRETNNSSYIFLSPKYANAIMDSGPFTKSIQSIITKYDIRDENHELWHFTIMQFRKTLAVTLIENGATTAELAYWLSHLNIRTSAAYYAEVRKMKLAEFNTKFFKKKFDMIISKEQLEKYTEEERRLLYIDFRLEQRRVELGYCLIKAADGRCPNRNSLYNCVNCPNLCTGKKYLPYWNDLLIQQKKIIESLISNYHADGIQDYSDFVQYKQKLHLLKGYENIVAAIREGDFSNE